jgi:hypothetical protein
VAAVIRGKTWATKIDFKSAFYQPLVSSTLALAFSFQVSDGQFAAYSALPMGWAWSPFLFNLILRPLDLLCQALGISAVRYADDIVVLSDSPEGLARDLKRLVALCHRLGWVISLTKSYLVAASTFVFLGVAVDLRRRAVSWTSAKYQKVIAACQLIRSASQVTARELQALVGRLSFLLSAIPVLRVFLRGFNEGLAGCHGADGSRAIHISPQLKAEADFWLSEEGAAIATRWWPLAADPARPRWRTQTDASAEGFGWGPVIAPTNFELAGTSFPLSAALATQSSAVREASALSALMRYLGDDRRPGPRLSEGDEVLVEMDARTVVDSVSRGSARAPQLVDELRSLASALLRLPPVLLSLRWISREENAVADAASRAVSMADARLSEPVFQFLQQWWTCAPAVDLFAASTNCRARRFYSRTPTTDAEGVDGLSAPLLPYAYGYPPFALAVPWAHRLRDYEASSVPVLAVVPADVAHAVLPAWPLPNMHLFPPDEPLVVPPPYTALPMASPRQLVALVIRPPL